MPPNVIVFLTDQQRWDTTGLHGNLLGLTPNFDRLAVQHTHLYHTFTCQPVCAPARAVLQTGLYATKTRVFRNGVPLSGFPNTLASCFGRAGYQTGYIGKWHLGNDDSAGPVEQQFRAGYDYWLAANLLEFTSTPYHTTLYDQEGKAIFLPGYRVDALTDAAIRFIAQARQAPFFLFLSFLEPHHQNHVDDYVPPDGYREPYTGRWLPPDLAALGGSAHQHIGGYYGMVKRLDEALGRVVDALKSLDILDETILLFTSDHGSHFKTRNGEYKRACQDSCVRVPGMLMGSGFVGGGQVRQLVSLVDLPPTLLDAAGLPVPAEMQGHSLMPVLRRQVLDWQDDVFIQISESQVGRAVRTSRWKYSVVDPQKNGWVDSGSEHYVEEYLYDLEADPYELTNLIGLASHQEVARVLRERLLKRMQQAGEAIPEIELAPVRASGQRVVSARETLL
jgi:arylsulfatase A-like enzyme